jgi:hypothetical protein
MVCIFFSTTKQSSTPSIVIAFFISEKLQIRKKQIHSMVGSSFFSFVLNFVFGVYLKICNFTQRKPINPNDDQNQRYFNRHENGTTAVSNDILYRSTSVYCKISKQLSGNSF